MLKLLNRYVVWFSLAIGLHALLLMILMPILEPIQLRLQSGHQAVSVQLARVASRQPSASIPPQSSSTDGTPVRLPEKNTRDFNKRIDKPLARVEAQVTVHKPAQKQASTKPQMLPKQANTSPPKPRLSKVVLDKSVTIKRITKAAELPVVVNDQPPLSSASYQESVAKPIGVLVVAQPLSGNNPKYPRRAIIRNQQGRVMVNFLVDQNGYVDNIELIESSGYDMLDESVIRFAEQERFIPAMKDGISIASTQSFLFRFVLE